MRFKAIFKDGSQYSLYGSEYYNDKPVFWRSHQSNLVGFSTEVCKKGRPIKILDNDNEIYFNNELEFDNWYKMHQSQHLDFGFSNLKESKAILNEAKTRIDKIRELLSIELDELKTKPFDPWKHDGGYKELDQLCNLGIISLEKINTSIGQNDELKLIQSCFEIPNKVVIDEHTILSYRKIDHEKIEPEKLIVFCKEIINQIEDNIKEL